MTAPTAVDPSTQRPARRTRRRVALAVAAVSALAPLATAGTASAITGGQSQQAGWLPYVAEVIYTPPPGTPGPGGLCTGALIHPRWVLTAQHCAETVPASTMSIRVGHTQRGVGGRFSTVTEIRRLPGYAGGHNDVALLRLSQYITDVPTVRLGAPSEAGFWDGQQGGPFTRFDQGTATGWGRDAAGNFPTNLQARVVDITTPVADANGVRRIPLASAGPCGGDSGGPLLVSANGRTVVAGVMKAAACGTAGSWYSEVGSGSNRDWIVQQVPDVYAPHPLTCKTGYVWRNAYSGDATCVTPASRSQAASDNYWAPYRRDPNGAWGPYTCVSGYVWREARPSDLVCVTPTVRSQTWSENSLAASRQN